MLEKAKWELHKDTASCCFEQILEAVPYKTAVVGHLPPIEVSQASHAGHCWRSKDELISNILQWTPINWPPNKNLHSLAVWTLEDLPREKADRDRGQREQKNSYCWHALIMMIYMSAT